MSYSAFYQYHHRLGLVQKGQAGSTATGTVAAGLAADGVVWTLRYPESVAGVLSPGAGAANAKKLYVGRIEVVVTTVVAFTTPVTAGRHLKLVRGTGPAGTADPSGGAAWTPARKRSDLDANVEALGVGRVATTGALTTTGFTFEANAIRRLPLAGAGASGAVASASWIFDGRQAAPVVLLPGQVLALAAGATFDAAGTWEMFVDVDFAEVP